MEKSIFSLISKTWSQASMGTVAVASPPSFLCLSQESRAPKSLGAGDLTLPSYESFPAPTRGGWIPVTSTGMREYEATTLPFVILEGHR
ncbi:hypothetical protein GGE16_003128 [Rhizobium leguminosarum]|uniref:Uncharacterized protein n=1 Tax=Rhizobium leguminosarum TaxID=384 RepID=A0AAE2MKR7_RHILE|nr:hypothetical protein [Rhizobium leguminosarum]MBB4430220.1 hypothetical protein [Rhizobium esperanzae]MBB4297835.1 hypothetical protein [Rhizobium leguminosarum]MBB4308974.1 hypothetical protein [Rhizobium leguminosarum]MBB4416811.1 hypothetical protein [Rhizobium leguminosarum]